MNEFMISLKLYGNQFDPIDKGLPCNPHKPEFIGVKSTKKIATLYSIFVDNY